VKRPKDIAPSEESRLSTVSPISLRSLNRRYAIMHMIHTVNQSEPNFSSIVKSSDFACSTRTQAWYASNNQET